MPPSKSASVEQGTAHVMISHSNATLLSPSELSSILSLAESPSTTTLTSEQQRRAELAAKSTARSSHWPNTLQAQRSAKRAQREQRRCVEEKRNSVVDDDEAAFRDAERRRVVERADRLLYQDRDAVKSLRTAINLSLIDHARRQQLSERTDQRRTTLLQDAQFHATAEALRLAALTLEDAKTAQQKHSRLLLAQSQVAQLADYRAKQAAARAEEVAEGERRRAVQEVAGREAAEEEARKVAGQRALNLSYLAANADQLARQASREEEERAEALRVTRYAEEKERVLEGRRRREEEAREEKVRVVGRMVEVQAQHLMGLKEREGKRLERQVVEEQGRAVEEEGRRERGRQERLRVEREVREAQVRCRREEQVREAKEERRRVEAEVQKAGEAQRREEEEERERRREARRVMEAQRVQARERAQTRRQREAVEAAEEKEREEVGAAEDRAFDRYAQGKMAELEAQGLNFTPVKLALEAEKIRKTRLKV